MKKIILAILLSSSSVLAQTGFDALQNSQHRYAAEHGKSKSNAKVTEKNELNVNFTKIQEIQGAFIISAKIERKNNGQLESACTFTDKRIEVETRLGEKDVYNNARMNNTFPCGNDEASIGAVKYYTNLLTGSFIDVRLKTDSGEVLFYHHTQGSAPSSLGPKN